MTPFTTPPKSRGSIPWQTWRDQLIDLVFPPLCAGCGRLGSALCPQCEKTVRWVKEPICQRCGRPSAASESLCFNCRRHPLPLAQIRAAVHFDGPVRQAIHVFKYRGAFQLARPLANLMAVAWTHWSIPADLVLPIPLHPLRYRWRGYNQSHLLVEKAKGKLEWKTDPLALRRARDTRPQIDMDNADQRRANVRGAFVADPGRVAGKHILLVDDVCTSGATLTEAAETLLAAGAHSVSAYCLAHAARGQDAVQ